MFSFISNTKEEYIVAEVCSATFLCPEIVPVVSIVTNESTSNADFFKSFSNFTPIEEANCKILTEYSICSENNESFAVAALPLATIDDFIACETQEFNFEEIITVTETTWNETSSVFQFEKYISSSFYTIVYNSDYLPIVAETVNSAENGKYYCCIVGYLPYGMELKIRIKNFKL